MNSHKLNVAVVGATGLVGGEMAKVLEERRFPVGRLVPAATEFSSGRSLQAFGKKWQVVTPEEIDFSEIDLCLFTAGADVSRELVPKALECGSHVVDNSPAFRMDPNVPLIVPEINGTLVTSGTRLAASPNCTTIIMTVALAPIHREAPIRRIVATSFQSVSGTGRDAVSELDEQVEAWLEGREATASVYPSKIAFNVIAWIGDLEEDGYSGEECKIVRETRKILQSPSLAVVPTTVRVPVRVGHAISVALELERPLSEERAKELIEEAPGARVESGIPTPLDVAGGDEVVVGRIRRDASVANGLVLWIVGDNLRKGAATNSVQIAELMLKRR